MFLQPRLRRVCLAAAALWLAPAPSEAALVLTHYTSGTSGVDAAFENEGGYLATTYGLSKSDPACVSNCTVLPALERAVGQIARNNANGLFLPFVNSGQPAPVGTGVTKALTNFGVLGAGTQGTVTGGPFSVPTISATDVDFTFKRIGDIVSYQVGGVPTVWTANAQDYFADMNALEFRMRSVAALTFEIRNLVYSDAVTTGQAPASLVPTAPNLRASNGDVAIAVFGGMTGDFTLSGTYRTSWTGPTQPNGWNHQIKGLALPAVDTPEPASVVLLGAALAGLAGLRRPRGRHILMHSAKIAMLRRKIIPALCA